MSDMSEEKNPIEKHIEVSEEIDPSVHALASSLKALHLASTVEEAIVRAKEILNSKITEANIEGTSALSSVKDITETASSLEKERNKSAEQLVDEVSDKNI